jgi:hypothetical protein
MNRVTLGPEYFPNSTASRSLASAYIYVGEPDTDPEIVGNQKQISVLEEDGSITPVSQPLRTSSGGVPVYNGSPVTMLVNGSYSLKILDQSSVQIFYIPSNVETSLYKYQADASETDHGITGNGGTIKALVDEIGSDNESIYFKPGIYTLTTSETIPANIDLVFAKGAVITGTGTLTINGGISAGSYQIFGSSITIAGSPLIEAAYPNWYLENTTPGTTDMASAINTALAWFPVVKLLGEEYFHSTDIIINDGNTIEGLGNSSVLSHTSGNMTKGGISVDGASGDYISNVRIRNLKIQGTGSRSGTFDSTDKGIFQEYVEDIIVDSVEVTAVNGEAIYCQNGAKDLTWTRNRVYDVAFNAYDFNGVTAESACRVINNYATQCGNMGMEMAVSDAIITNNYINDVDNEGIYIGGWASAGTYGDRVIVANNIVTEVGAVTTARAIECIWGPRSVIITGNIVYDNPYGGIYINGDVTYTNRPESILIHGNIAYDNGGAARAGIEINGGIKVDLINNNCFNTATGTQGYGIHISGAVTEGMVENNRLYDNATQDLLRDAVGHIVFGRNWISDGVAAGHWHAGDQLVKNYTTGTNSLTDKDYGLTITNTGSVTTNTVQVGGAIVGATFGPFINTSAAQVLRVDPASGTQQFRGQAGGKYLELGVGESVTIECQETDTWDIIAVNGTPSYEP